MKNLFEAGRVEEVKQRIADEARQLAAVGHDESRAGTGTLLRGLETGVRGHEAAACAFRAHSGPHHQA